MKGRIAAFAMATAVLSGIGGFVPAHAQQTFNDAFISRAKGTDDQKGSGKLLVEARTIIYDNDRNTVAASGDVELNHQGRTLQADKVTYDRNTRRVFASGNVRMTDTSGAIVTGERFELTDDFRDGFIESLRIEQVIDDRGRKVRARFSSPRAERIDGDTTVFNRGIYTVCDTCKTDPSRPPMWQVKAARIIHNNTERTIYYEDARFELWGIPVAYMPFFWSPDPSVKRKTGILTPHYNHSNALGYGLTIPFFWELAPNYDLTLQPTYLTRQGFLGDVEWRHRLDSGSYRVRGYGIFQDDPTAFARGLYGAGDKDFRGALETSGEFRIDERWKWGWNGTIMSDKWFFDNYRLTPASLSSIYYKEIISTAYLHGQGDRSLFDLRAYYFQGLSTYDWQEQQPVVHPVLDYSKTFAGPEAIGGEMTLDVNLTSMSRQAAQYQQTPQQMERLFWLYETCAVFEKGSCLVRGMAGNSTRLSTRLSWQRQFIDPAGQVWKPFASIAGDAYWVSTDFNGYQNAFQSNLINGTEDFSTRLMPAVGLEYRYPLVASFGKSHTQVLEPIAQIVARPNEQRIGNLPNEDAQSLTFDDTNLFEWNKFSGYDRQEGGVRANLGVQYTIMGDGSYANLLFGQSYQLAGRNSYAQSDYTNTGLDSGLDSRASDFIGRFQYAPNTKYSFLSRARFDKDNLNLNRLEAGLSINFNPMLPVTASLMYARYEAQPHIGYGQRRTGLWGSARWNITPRWFLDGAVLLDLDHDQTTTTTNSQSVRVRNWERGNISFNSMSFSLGYADECSSFQAIYQSTPKELAVASGQTERDQSIIFKLEFKTLGEFAFSQSENE